MGSAAVVSFGDRGVSSFNGSCRLSRLPDLKDAAEKRAQDLRRMYDNDFHGMPFLSEKPDFGIRERNLELQDREETGADDDERQKDDHHSGREKKGEKDADAKGKCRKGGDLGAKGFLHMTG